MRTMLSVQTGLLIGFTNRNRALKQLKNFFKDKMAIMTLVSKIKKFADAAVFLQHF